MRRITHILSVVTLLLGIVSCEKDFFSVIGLDAAAPIECKLSGSNYNLRDKKFSSDGGVYTSNNHPEIVMKDDGGFSLELYRNLVSKNGNEATLYLYINNSKPFKLNETYNLADMACIDFREQGATTTLPSGGTVTDIITHCYRATEGTFRITKMETYGSDHLISGEFQFKAKCGAHGDTLEVKSGKFSNCRIHISYGTDCNGNKVE